MDEKKIASDQFGMAKRLQYAAETRKRLLEDDAENDKGSKSTQSLKTKRTETAVSKSGKNNKKKAENESNVIYIGHIPHGFYEKEIKKFFSQFGNVQKVKLFRSAKTNNSKGYAFVQFEENETAGIAAESMNGYFMQERQLVSHVVPSAEIHDGMFKYPKKKEADIASVEEIEATEKEISSATTDMIEKAASNLKRSQRSKEKRLKALGIDYDVSKALSAS